MAAVTHVCTIEHVAKMLGEDLKMLEAIVENDDNLSYGAIVSVHTGSEEAITALTDDGIEELKDMLHDARRSALLHKSADGRGSPFPGQSHPMASVTGIPSAVKPFRTATRTWNSAT